MATVDASIVIVSMPAIFRGIGLDPLAAGNISYLLWLIIGYLLVTAVAVVALGRLGDIYGRVRIYNMGFVIFSAASLALSLDPLRGTRGAMWLIGFRIVQAVGGAMLMANSAAILTDAFPAESGAWRSASTRSPRSPASSSGCSREASWSRSTGGGVLGQRAVRHHRHDLVVPQAA